MALPLLEGTVDTRDRDIERLEGRIADLEGELEVAQAEARRATQQASRAVARLRGILSPLYNGLRELFGEMDATGLDELPSDNGAAVNSADPLTNAAWEKWKQQLGGKQAEFIAAMQSHGEMTVAQLKVVTHSGSSTIPQIIYKLNKLGLINKNGGKYSLKKL